MNLDELQTCANVLGQLADFFLSMPDNEDKVKAIECSCHCRLVQNYVLELQHHLVSGLDAFDAMEATVKGETKPPVSEATWDVLRAIRPIDLCDGNDNPKLP